MDIEWLEQCRDQGAGGCCISQLPTTEQTKRILNDAEVIGILGSGVHGASTHVQRISELSDSDLRDGQVINYKYRTNVRMNPIVGERKILLCLVFLRPKVRGRHSFTEGLKARL